MRHKEEVKLAIHHFRLLNKACVNVGSLGRVVDEVLPIVAWRLLEESLADALVDDDQGDVWESLGRVLLITSVLHLDNVVELSKLLVND